MFGGRKLSAKLYAAGLVLVVAVTAGLLTYFHWFHPGISIGAEQPIPFSHRLHVTDKGIDCYYCHSYPGRSLNAGVPAVSKCLGCHDHIISNHPAIKKLASFRDRNQALPWVRVFYKPDHAFFPHYRHIGMGVQCSECHGAVEQMDRLKQETFYMGFCLDCHQERGASLGCWACHQ